MLTIFSWPGLGNLLAEAIGNRDFPLVQGVAFFASLVVISMNFLTDIAYALVDPRIRYRGIRMHGGGITPALSQ